MVGNKESGGGMFGGGVEVVDVPQRQRFEIRLGDRTVGCADYHLSGGDTIEFTHTEVDDAHQGENLGSRLARGALDDVRSRGRLRVVPTCPFIAEWIDRHPDYQDLLAA